MRWIVCLSMFSALGFAPAPVYKPRPTEKDLELLQGKWVFVSSRDDDRPVHLEEGRFIVVRGSHLEFQDRSGSSTRQYRILLDDSKPGRMRLQEVGQTVISDTPHVGLYRIRGNQFVFCFGTTRGLGATSIEGGQEMRRLVFERVPKP